MGLFRPFTQISPLFEILPQKNCIYAVETKPTENGFLVQIQCESPEEEWRHRVAFQSPLRREGRCSRRSRLHFTGIMSFLGKGFHLRQNQAGRTFSVFICSACDCCLWSWSLTHRSQCASLAVLKPSALRAPCCSCQLDWR